MLLVFLVAAFFAGRTFERVEYLAAPQISATSTVAPAREYCFLTQHPTCEEQLIKDHPEYKRKAIECHGYVMIPDNPDVNKCSCQVQGKSEVFDLGVPSYTCI